MNQLRTVSLCITKIFNWNSNKSDLMFHFSFLSKDQKVMYHKIVKGKISQNNQIILNCSFKISYPSEENAVVLKMERQNSKSGVLDLLADITVNLDLLQQKKFQFFPFGDNDKVLQIRHYQDYKEMENANSRVDLQARPHSPSNDHFIRQRQQFLKRLQNQSSARSYCSADSRFRINFSDKVNKLLRETREVHNLQKYQLSGSRIDEFPVKKSSYIQPVRQNREYNFRNNDQRPIYSVKRISEQNKFKQKYTAYPPINYEPKITKSSSQHQIASGKPIKNKFIATNTNAQSSKKSETSSQRSQKHKLILKNLKIVPCANEYYDTEITRNGLSEHKPSVRSQKYFSESKVK